MSKDPYKFKLHYLLRQLPKDQYDLALKKLPIYLGVSKQTFKRWIYTRENSSVELTGCQLLVLANFFEVKPQQIYTSPPEAVTKIEFFNPKSEL